MKFINLKFHGVLDFVTVAAFAAIPTLFGLSGIPAYLSYALAAIHLLMTLLTNFPFGVLKLLPVKLHQIVELAVGPVLLICPWALGFAADLTARWLFVGMGVILILVGQLTRYEHH